MKYLIGTLDLLQQKVPNIDFTYVRKSLDGKQAVISVAITDDEAAGLSEAGLKVVSEDDARNFLNGTAQAGVWYQADIPMPPEPEELPAAAAPEGTK